MAGWTEFRARFIRFRWGIFAFLTRAAVDSDDHKFSNLSSLEIAENRSDSASLHFASK